MRIDLTISIYEPNHTVKFSGKNNSVLLETNLKTDSEETVKRLNRKSHDKRHSLREILMTKKLKSTP